MGDAEPDGPTPALRATPGRVLGGGRLSDPRQARRVQGDQDRLEGHRSRPDQPAGRRPFRPRHEARASARTGGEPRGRGRPSVEDVAVRASCTRGQAGTSAGAHANNRRYPCRGEDHRDHAGRDAQGDVHRGTRWTVRLPADLRVQCGARQVHRRAGPAHSPPAGSRLDHRHPRQSGWLHLGRRAGAPAVHAEDDRADPVLRPRDPLHPRHGRPQGATRRRARSVEGFAQRRRPQRRAVRPADPDHRPRRVQRAKPAVWRASGARRRPHDLFGRRPVHGRFRRQRHRAVRLRRFSDRCWRGQRLDVRWPQERPRRLPHRAARAARWDRAVLRLQARHALGRERRATDRGRRDRGDRSRSTR